MASSPRKPKLATRHPPPYLGRTMAEVMEDEQRTALRANAVILYRARLANGETPQWDRKHGKRPPTPR